MNALHTSLDTATRDAQTTQVQLKNATTSLASSMDAAQREQADVRALLAAAESRLAQTRQELAQEAESRCLQILYFYK
jgi:hypothetical protein